MSQLDRSRLRDNFLDRQDAAALRITRQERATPTADGQARVYAGGILLAVLDVEPEPPPPGYVLDYAQREGDVVYRRSMDADGVVKELADWT